MSAGRVRGAGTPLKLQLNFPCLFIAVFLLTFLLSFLLSLFAFFIAVFLILHSVLLFNLCRTLFLHSAPLLSYHVLFHAAMEFFAREAFSESRPHAKGKHIK